MFFHETCCHAGEHHAESHEGRADGIVRGLVRTLGKVHHEQHEGCETKAVCKLLKNETAEYGGLAGNCGKVGLEVRQYNVCDTVERCGQCHGPNPLAQTALRGADTADDTADGKAEDGKHTVSQAYFALSHAETAGIARCKHERLTEFHYLSLGQAVKKHEEHGEQHMLFHEEGLERAAEFLEDAANGLLLLTTYRTVGIRIRQDECVPKEYQCEECGTDYNGKLPAHRSAAGSALKEACDDHEATLAEYAGTAVECGADTYKHTLLVGIESKHVETVGCYIMSSRAECCEHIESQADCECANGHAGSDLGRIGHRQGEGDGCEADCHAQLHHHCPPALCL